ncbi:MAG: HU family DNA-binding protein [Bacteroidaceae bacterium]|nr:HU family DNA-binding protein [Bacteroidaceae bacterium]
MAIVIVKKSRKLAFKEGKPVVQVLRPVRYQNVKSEDLVAEIAQTQGITKTMALAVVEAYVNRMVHYMELGLGVEMGDFGIFKPTINSKSTANADDLNQECIVRKKILFHPGKQFRQMLKNMSVQMADDAEAADETESTDPTEASGEGGDESDNEDGNNGSSGGSGFE